MRSSASAIATLGRRQADVRPDRPVALGRLAQSPEVVGAPDGIEVTPRDQALCEARFRFVEPHRGPCAGLPEANRDAGLVQRAHGVLHEGALPVGLGTPQAELSVAAVETDQPVARRGAGAFPRGQLDDGTARLAL